MSVKVAEIPEENVITPSPIVAMPEESDLKEMYLNLLATASDNRCADQAHPAFAEIIKQLAPEEAKALSSLLAFRTMPVAQVRRFSNDPPGSYSVLIMD